MLNDIHSWAHRWGIPADAHAELIAIVTPHPSVVEDAGKSEASVQQKMRVEAAAMGHALWRNNNGAAMSEDGRMLRFGLGNDSSKLSKVWKSSDLIGITRVQSTYVGQIFGVFTAQEVKRPGWRQVPSDKRAIAQAKFMANVRALGGIAGFAQSVDDYKRMIGQ